MSDTRVVLVKPGDLLIIGNLGELALDPEAMEDAALHLEALKDLLGLAGVFVFEGDIDLAAVAQARAADGLVQQQPPAPAMQRDEQAPRDEAG